MNSYTKRGGAARRRFCVICKKPEGGGRKSTPPGVRVLILRQFRIYVPSSCSSGKELSIDIKFEKRKIFDLRVFHFARQISIYFSGLL